MQKEFVSNVEKANKAALESAKKLGDINFRMLERIAERNLEFTADYLATGVESLKLFGESKDPQKAVNGQVKLVSDLNEKIVDHVKKTAEVLADAKGEYTEWFEAGMKSVTESPFAVAPKAAAKKAA